ncbi:Aromatic/aminoadipate aminotransferase 1, partial [Ascosphaera acerosa]
MSPTPVKLADAPAATTDPTPTPAPAPDPGSEPTTAAAPPRLTLAGVPALRAKTALPTALVAASSSDMFKSPACFAKPRGKDWRGWFTREASTREQPKLKTIAPLMKLPDMISLAGGLPSSEYFPFDSISISHPAAPDFSSTSHATATKTDIVGGLSPL